MKPEIDESTVFKRPQVPKLTLKRGKGSSSFQLQKTLKKVIGKVVPHYIPCGHTGICTSENCSCFVNGSQCDKFCLCLESCPNRFLPCKCRGECNSNSCGCFMASRECDPDRCRACGSNEMDNEKRLCKNVNIQYRLGKNSSIHGRVNLKVSYFRQKCENWQVLSQWLWSFRTGTC